MTQPTDEAAVPEWMLPVPDDIIEALDRLIRQRTGTLDQWPQPPIVEQRARDEIETLRAQLTAATRRAEQAERMLAEAVAGLERVESSTGLSLERRDIARAALTTIRSAASGEQG